jgi:hypothetical protein
MFCYLLFLDLIFGHGWYTVLMGFDCLQHQLAAIAAGRTRAQPWNSDELSTKFRLTGHKMPLLQQAVER